MKDTFKVVLATKREIPQNMPLYMMPSLPDEAGSLLVGDRELLYFKGVLGVYVAGYVEGFCMDKLVAEVKPVSDMEKLGVMEDVMKKYKDTKVSFTNPGYSIF